MDKVQSSYVKCCGVHSYKDYVYKSGGNSTGNSTTNEYNVPKSCCKDEKNCKADQVIDDSYLLARFEFCLKA